MAQIPKGQAMEKFHLERDDFVGLDFEEKPVKGKTYFIHLYEIKDVWRRAVELGRIEDSSTPQPQPIQPSEPVTTAQMLLRLPGCATVDQLLAPWIWRAVVRYYEHLDSFNPGLFCSWSMREDIAYQLRTAAVELNLKYLRYPRATAPLPSSRSVEDLRWLLSRAPRCSSDGPDVPVGIEFYECPFSGDTSTSWARGYKIEVNEVVAEVVREHGRPFEMAARWLVYDTVSLFTK